MEQQQQIINAVKKELLQMEGSVRQFCKRLGIAELTLTNFLNGKNTTIANLIKICEELNLKINITKK